MRLSCWSTISGGETKALSRISRVIGGASIADRHSVLARIGAAMQRALIPIDPDRLRAADGARRHVGLVTELLEPGLCRSGQRRLDLHAAGRVLVVGEDARLVDRFLHAELEVEDVGQQM